MTRLLREASLLLLNRALTPIFVGVLVEGFVGARHAKLVACALLDRLAAGLEILHLGGERGVAPLEQSVLLLCRAHLAVELPGAQPAPFAEPQRVLDEHDERRQDVAEDSHLARTNASRPG